MFQKVIKKLFKKVLIYVLSLILLLLAPIFLFLLSPILVYRQIVIRLSTWLRPTFDSILNPFSSIIANIDLHKDPVLGTTAALVFNGRLELEQVCESFQDRILNLRNPINGELVYPRLTQKVRKWLGYYFWEPDEEFDLQSHFQVYDEGESSMKESVVTQDDLLKIMEGMMNAPFSKDKSPWRITLVHNARLTSDPPGVRNKSVIILNFHHVISGGECSMDFLRAWCSDPSLLDVKPILNNIEGSDSSKMTVKKYIMQIVRIMKLILFGPYELLSQINAARDQNQWTTKSKTDWTGKCNTDISEPIPLKLISAIKNIYSTSFMAVILAAYASGIKAFMVNNGIPVPSAVHCVIPIHFDDLNSSNAVVKLPLNITNSETRLRVIDQELQKLKYLSLYRLVELLQNLVGRLPSGLLSYLPDSLGNTVMLTNVPGPPEKIILCNTEGACVMSSTNIRPGLSLAATVITYNDHLRITLGADQGVVPFSQPTKDLNSYITEEISELLKLEIV